MDISRQASGQTTPHAAGVGSLGAFPGGLTTDPTGPTSPSHVSSTSNFLALHLDHGFGSNIHADDIPKILDLELPLDDIISRHHSIDEMSFERLLRGGGGPGNNSDPARLTGAKGAAVHNRRRFVVIAVECAEDVKRAVELMDAYRSGEGSDAQSVAAGVGQVRTGF